MKYTKHGLNIEITRENNHFRFQIRKGSILLNEGYANTFGSAKGTAFQRAGTLWRFPNAYDYKSNGLLV